MTKKNSAARMRVRQRDVEQAIFRPKDPNDEDTLPDHLAQWGDAVEREVVVYTIFGKHDDLDSEGRPILEDYTDDDGDSVDAEDEPNAYAKSVIVNGGHLHYSVLIIKILLVSHF